jgi:hypothetical protein
VPERHGSHGSATGNLVPLRGPDILKREPQWCTRPARNVLLFAPGLQASAVLDSPDLELTQGDLKLGLRARAAGDAVAWAEAINNVARYVTTQDVKDYQQ